MLKEWTVATELRDTPGFPRDCTEARPSMQSRLTALGSAEAGSNVPRESCSKAQRQNTEGKEVCCLQIGSEAHT